MSETGIWKILPEYLHVEQLEKEAADYKMAASL